MRTKTLPIVCAGITTVFIGGIDHIALCGLSTFTGISMATRAENRYCISDGDE